MFSGKGFNALNKNIWERYVGKKGKCPAKGFCNLCEEDKIKESVLYTFHLIRKIQALKSKNN